jgi:site-specific DNA-methyltransferase (adenine-specific)
METNKIYNENCLETMSRMKDNFIDLTVTSPPYDNIRTYNGYEFDFKTIAKELYRVTKEGGVVVWIVGDATVKGSETGTSFRQALYFMECGFKLHDTMIYKQNRVTFPHKNLYHQCFEYMFILVKGKIKTANLIHDRKNKNFNPNNNKTFDNTHREPNGKLIKKKSNPIKEYGARWSIWQYNTGKNKSTKDDIAFKHPAIFPEKLANDHIISWSNEGELVYDCFMGSGTTAKMSLLNNRKYIGSEISKEYVDIANKRLIKYKTQNKLF